jgi:sulfide:quinone oxidoreductase
MNPDDSSPPVHWLTPKLAVCPQIGAHDVPAIAEMGFKTIICNRPDNEYGPGQPTADEVQTAASALGLAFADLPVTPDGGTASDATAMGKLLADLPAPVLAYCRTGNRCIALISVVARMGYPIPR